MNLWQSYADFVRKRLNPRRNAQAVGGAIRRGAEESRGRRGKLTVDVGGNRFRLVPIKTRIFTEEDDIGEIVALFVQSQLEEGDIIAISESLVAITQGRAFPMAEIRPGFFAKLLYPWVTHVSYGTGLGSPGSMQKAIEEVGVGRIVLATFCALPGRLVRRRGAFYGIAGERVRSIDVRWNHPIPLRGARDYVILSPLSPQEVCDRLHQQTNHPVAIVDVNDVSSRVLAHRGLPIAQDHLAEALRGNPAGQDGERTPFVLVRREA